jgi:hypothetical protein
VITKKKKLPELVVRTAGAPLALEPGGPAVAGLKAGSPAQVLETQKGATRVLIDAFGYAIVGWVDSSALGNGFGVGYGRLGRRHVYRRSGWSRGKICDHDLELVAEVGATRVRVGLIKAGARFDAPDPAKAADPDGLPPRRSRRERSWRRVAFPQLRWLRLENKARLIVDEAELSTCAPE